MTKIQYATVTASAAKAFLLAGAAAIAVGLAPARADTSTPNLPQPAPPSSPAIPEAGSAPTIARATLAPNAHLPNPDVLQLAPYCNAPAQVIPGRPFALTAGAFSAGTINLYVDQPSGELITSVSRADEQPFSVDVTWPTNTGIGKHQVYAAEAESKGKVGTPSTTLSARCDVEVTNP